MILNCLQRSWPRSCTSSNSITYSVTYVVRLFSSFLVFSFPITALGAYLMFRWVWALACSWIRSTGVSYCLWADCSIQTWALLAPSSGPFCCLPVEPGSSRRPGLGQSCLLVSFLSAMENAAALHLSWLVGRAVRANPAKWWLSDASLLPSRSCIWDRESLDWCGGSTLPMEGVRVWLPLGTPLSPPCLKEAGFCLIQGGEE